MQNTMPTQRDASALLDMAEMLLVLDAVLADQVPSRARWETRNAHPVPLEPLLRTMSQRRPAQILVPAEAMQK